MTNGLQNRLNTLRLRGHDYATPGVYFVTICSYQMECTFGFIEDAQCVKEPQFDLSPSPLGHLIIKCWQSIPDWFQNVKLDKFVVMPNHLHGLLQINNDEQIQPTALTTIIASFKSSVTRQWNQQNGVASRSVWQRSFHDHIVRNEKSLNQKRQYIQDNPLKWHLDELNPNWRRSI